MSNIKRYIIDHEETFNQKLPVFDSIVKTDIINNISIEGYGESSNYYTNLFESYIKFDTSKDVTFTFNADDDLFIWIYKGEIKWQDTSHNSTISYEDLSNYIPDSSNLTLLISHFSYNFKTSTNTYNFDADTIYTILIKYGQNTSTSKLTYSISFDGTTETLSIPDLSNYFTINEFSSNINDIININEETTNIYSNLLYTGLIILKSQQKNIKKSRQYKKGRYGKSKGITCNNSVCGCCGVAGF